MDREELEYAMELYIEQTLEKRKSKTGTNVDSGSDEDESYRPSPEVCPRHTIPLLLSHIMTYFFVQIPKKPRNKKDTSQNKGKMAVIESSTNDDILIDKVRAFFVFAEV